MMPIKLEQHFDCLVIFTEESVSACFPRPIEEEIEAELRSVCELNPGICLKYFDSDCHPEEQDRDYQSNWQNWIFTVLDFYDQKDVAFAIANCLRNDHGLRVKVDNRRDFDQLEGVLVTA